MKVGRKKERKSRIVSIGLLKLVRSRKEAVNISEVEERGSCASTVCVNVPVQSMNIHNKTKKWAKQQELRLSIIHWGWTDRSDFRMEGAVCQVK